MVCYKTETEIVLMRKSAELLSRVHGEVAKYIGEGLKLNFLDKIAEEFIQDHGAAPSFLGYNGFPNALCMSLNEVVVHGIPTDYTLRDGDMISIDCGVYMNDFHADSAYTYAIGNVGEHIIKLLEVTRKALDLGIAQVEHGKRIGDISYAIQTYAQQNGFSVVRELVGHGLGRALHEKPEVPNFGKKGRGLMLRNGLVIAIEPMINMGKKAIIQANDKWSIVTRDRKPSAHYEHTVAIHNNETEVLTTFKYIEEALNARMPKHTSLLGHIHL